MNTDCGSPPSGGGNITWAFGQMLGWMLICTAGGTVACAQQGTLAEPFPSADPNAALHYQRAMLYLAAIDPDVRAPLGKPVWELLPRVPAADALPQNYQKLLYLGRHSLRSAAIGSRLERCDFGIDFREGGAATALPHLQPMLELSRLLLLRAEWSQARGEWHNAVAIYFDALRMGRHMAAQNTLLEANVGIGILQNTYFALSRWAVRCPDKTVIDRAFELLAAMGPDMVRPARTAGREASILQLRFAMFRRQFPDGPWAEILLEQFGLPVPQDNPQAVRQAAMEACVERGVARETFRSREAFHRHLDRLTETYRRYAEQFAACMTLPPPARAKRGESLYASYSEQLGALGAELTVNPAEVGVLLALHDAELRLARVVVALAAEKRDGRFPESLKKIASHFGGRVPASPYNDGPIDYQPYDDGRNFSIEVPSLQAGSVIYPRVDFDSSPPDAASDAPSN